MINLRQHTASFEITLAFFGAFGMISMMFHPLVGKAIMGGVLALLFLLYFADILVPQDTEDGSRFQVMINRINYLGAACSSVLLLLLLLFLPGRQNLAFIGIGTLSMVLILNLTHRYLYKITDNGYFNHQLRLLLLLGLTVVVMVWGG